MATNKKKKKAPEPLSPFDKVGPQQDAVAVMFDIRGFTAFINNPDPHHYVHIFLNEVFSAVEKCIFGGEFYWLVKPRRFGALPFGRYHSKFLGDGGLLLLAPPKDAGSYRFGCTGLMVRLWNLKERFAKVLSCCRPNVHTGVLPDGIRIGVARGGIHRLSAPKRRVEFVGNCINLASRLERHCPALDFIASARLPHNDEDLDIDRWKKVLAINIKGYDNGEMVIVDGHEWDMLDPEVRKSLFKEID